MTDNIELPKAYLHKINDYIICLTYKPDVNIKLEDAKIVNSAIYELAGGKEYTVLVDVRGLYGNMTNEARVHFATDQKTKHIRVAEAILLDNLPARILARFYIKVNKPNNSAKIFSNKDNALEWLKEIYATNKAEQYTY